MPECWGRISLAFRLWWPSPAAGHGPGSRAPGCAWPVAPGVVLAALAATSPSPCCPLRHAHTQPGAATGLAHVQQAADADPSSDELVPGTPSSRPQGLRATIFSVELGARSCNLPGCLPLLSPTARESRDPTLSPQLATGRTSSVSSRTASCSLTSPWHTAVCTYVETAATTAGSAAETKKVAKFALREPGGYDFTPLVVKSYDRYFSATHRPLNYLGRFAADSGRVSQGTWVDGARCGNCASPSARGTTLCSGKICMPSAVPAVNIPPGALRCPCLLYTSPSPRDRQKSRMPSSA